MSTERFRASSPSLRAAVPVYAAALLLGLTLVTVPASSAVLVRSLNLTAAQYGGLFVPQLVGALVCGLGLATLGRRVPLRVTLLVAILCLTAVHALLAASQFTAPDTGYVILMAATLLVGSGIGFGAGPLNAYPALIFPRLAGTAVTAVHVVAGIGMMIAPLYHALTADLGHWVGGLALLVGSGGLILLAATLVRLPEEAPPPAAAGHDAPARNAAIWLLVAAAMIHSVAEGMFTNWTILYLQGRAIEPAAASLALTAFLGGVTAGRLVASFLVVRIPPVMFLRVLPVFVALAFLLLPAIRTGEGAILAFGFAGLACSAYFPMLITYAAQADPSALGWVATLMISAQMAGIGLGTYVVGGFVGSLSFAQLYRLATILPVATLALLAMASRGQARRPIEARSRS